MRAKLILWVVGIGLAAGAYLAATEAMKAWAERSLSELFEREASIRSLYLTPWGFHLSGVVVPPGPGERSTVSVEQVSVRISFLSLVLGRPRFQLRLDQPQILFERDLKRVRHLPLARLNLGKGMGIPVCGLRIQRGDLIFLDRAVSPAVFCRVRNFSARLRADRSTGGFSFSAAGLLEGRSRQPIGKFQADGRWHPAGWSETHLSFEHKGLEQMAPYLKKVLGSAPSQGSLKVDSTITLLGKEVLADNQVTASGVSFAVEEPTVLGLNGNRLVGLLKDSQGVIRLSFFVRGNLGQSLVSGSNWLEATLRESLQQAMARNIQRSLTEAEPPRSAEESIRRGMESIGR